MRKFRKEKKNEESEIVTEKMRGEKNQITG